MQRKELISSILMECTKERSNYSSNDMAIVPMTINITKEDLISGSFQKNLNIIERAEKKKIKGKGSIILSFEGLDKRHLFKYPAVCRYLKRLFRNKPHLLYLLHPQCNLQVILLALVEIDVGSRGDLIENNRKSMAEFTFYGIDLAVHIKRYITKAVRYSNGLKESPEAQQDLIGSILDYIDYEQLLEDYPAL
ncbi:hypothetical protein OM416_20120 [Paenibacillus sp. LS1]|uniref:hypothetical protein n=1 Tax=Paenibacillus sp. LS1 TaxID=2992120 RepID=UPI002231F3CE|nr:hypothetical protein [Paenibacillus sp. LS1]MCW3793903.1 hypothetical protein [Paenibacillus sp. LS1]